MEQKTLIFFQTMKLWENHCFSDLCRSCKKYFADNLSYLDRLVTPVPLYNKEPETFNDIEKIGCAFLTRVIPVLEPRYYLEELKRGAHPSILSIADAISRPTFAGVYPKLFNDIALEL